AAATEAARRITTALRAAAEARGRADWATTGGSTPVPIYRNLTAQPLRDQVPWSRVHVWWGDDRVVPRDHPLSNRRPLDDVLLRVPGIAGESGSGEDVADIGSGEPGVPIPVANIHAMPIDLAIGRTGSADEAAREAAATYVSDLREAPLERDSAGYPVLDIILVGVGPDGHVFSVFPGSSAFDQQPWALPIPAPTTVEPHVARVTLNPRMLDAARLVLAVVLGGGKAEVLRAILQGPRNVRHLPSQLARRGGAVWILDEGAAAELSNPAELSDSAQGTDPAPSA
ncbi:MAG TPA: 6-phosphogluconolactonase, partial [Candidatus Limnocylindrales bacterium]|nr:6-phosphogluconolactonase [Candidatus Limnocylindrales bacterium]